MALEKSKKKKITMKDLELIIAKLILRVDRLEKMPKNTAKRAPAINKVETFNGEKHPEPREDTKMKMNYEDKLGSLKNATIILPPNLKVDGRHLAENCGAICGFIVTDEMLDEVYKD
jgi:hypothetical protein